MIHSNKDGSSAEFVGTDNCNLKQADTFDCQCLIVHSSLVKKYGLRFDENLTFDLYVEEFCINAYEKYKITSRILQIKCQHWSKGNIGERWYRQFEYLQNKYKNSRKLYNGTCFLSGYIGNNFIEKLIYKFKYKVKFNKEIFFRFLYQKKITKKGCLLIKVCKLPVISIANVENRKGE